MLMTQRKGASLANVDELGTTAVLACLRMKRLSVATSVGRGTRYRVVGGARSWDLGFGDSGFGNKKCKGFRISGFWDFGILGFWDFGILGFWDFGIWGFWIWK